jgi:hypothetical protein
LDLDEAAKKKKLVALAEKGLVNYVGNERLICLWNQTRQKLGNQV